MKPIAKRRDIEKLYKMSNGFKDFRDPLWTTPADYLKWADKVSKKAVHRSFSYPKPDDLFGKACGEPFANFFIKVFGPSLGLIWERVATESEDFTQASDAFAIPTDRRILADLIRISIKSSRVNTKGKVQHTLGIDRLGSLGWSLNEDNYNQPQVSVPLLVGLGCLFSYYVEQKVESSGGLCIDYYAICNHWGISNSLFQEYADACQDTYNHWQQKASDAVIEADARRNRPLDDIDNADLCTLQQNDGGFFIAPPGWGKTNIQGKLIESWLNEQPGPIVYLTRVKELLSQNVSDIVQVVRAPDGKFIDRILYVSDKDHPMDLLEPLAVGTGSNVKQLIIDQFKTKQNTIIGAVTYGEGTKVQDLLKLCLRNKFPLRLIIDEALEIFPNSAGEQLNGDWSEILTLLRKLKQNGLLIKAIGFDALWINGTLGMNDTSIWGVDKPLVEHDMREGIETNRLVPVEPVFLKIKKSDLDLLIATFPSMKRLTEKECIEVASAVKAMELEIQKLKAGVQSVAKYIHFGARSAVNRILTKVIKEKFPEVEVSAMIAYNTSLEDRRCIKDDFAKCQIGFLSSYNILAKGIDVPDTTAVQIGYGRMPEEDVSYHMIGRVDRRAKGERGLILDQCVIKKIGTVYITTFEDENNNKDPSANYAIKIYDTIMSTGAYRVSQTLVTATTGKSQERTNTSPFYAQDQGVIETDDKIVDLIKVEPYIPNFIEQFGNKKAQEELVQADVAKLLELLAESQQVDQK